MTVMKILPFRQGMFLIFLALRSLTFGDGNIAFQARVVSYFFSPQVVDLR
jgi:hypothetical protein